MRTRGVASGSWQPGLTVTQGRRHKPSALKMEADLTVGLLLAKECQDLREARRSQEPLLEPLERVALLTTPCFQTQTSAFQLYKREYISGSEWGHRNHFFKRQSPSFHLLGVFCFWPTDKAWVSVICVVVSIDPKVTRCLMWHSI